MPALVCRAIFTAAILAVSFAVTPASLTAQEQCAEWTPWSPIQPLPVLFSWRLCGTESQRWDVQWRFANTGTEEIEFEYDLFTGMGARCGEDNRGRRFAGGKYRLRPGQRDEHYSGRRRLRQSGFQQDFWLYLCLRTEAPE